MKSIEELTTQLAHFMEGEVVSHQGASIPYGEIDWEQLARLTIRHLSTEIMFEALNGRDTVKTGKRPIVQINHCSCKSPLIKHSFGLGSTCQMCGLPA